MRLASRRSPGKKWEPYLSERQWGAVREDYSENGNAWDYFSHDQARSRAYHWGEGGLAGIFDDKQRVRLNCIHHIMGLIPRKNVPREKMKLPKLSMEDACDEPESRTRAPRSCPPSLNP